MASVVKTLKEVFRTVKVYPEFNPDEGEGFGNIAVLASDSSPLLFDQARVRDFPVHPMAADVVRRFLGREYAFPEQTPSIILTDDYYPGDVYDLRLKEAVRRNILENTHWDILI